MGKKKKQNTQLSITGLVWNTVVNETADSFSKETYSLLTNDVVELPHSKTM